MEPRERVKESGHNYRGHEKSISRNSATRSLLQQKPLCERQNNILRVVPEELSINKIKKGRSKHGKSKE